MRHLQQCQHWLGWAGAAGLGWRECWGRPPSSSPPPPACWGGVFEGRRPTRAWAASWGGQPHAAVRLREAWPRQQPLHPRSLPGVHARPPAPPCPAALPPPRAWSCSRCPPGCPASRPRQTSTPPHCRCAPLLRVCGAAGRALRARAAGGAGLRPAPRPTAAARLPSRPTGRLGRGRWAPPLTAATPHPALPTAARTPSSTSACTQWRWAPAASSPTCRPLAPTSLTRRTRRWGGARTRGCGPSQGSGARTARARARAGWRRGLRRAPAPLPTPPRPPRRPPPPPPQDRKEKTSFFNWCAAGGRRGVGGPPPPRRAAGVAACRASPAAWLDCLHACTHPPARPPQVLLLCQHRLAAGRHRHRVGAGAPLQCAHWRRRGGSVAGGGGGGGRRRRRRAPGWAAPPRCLRAACSQRRRLSSSPTRCPAAPPAPAGERRVGGGLCDPGPGHAGRHRHLHRRLAALHARGAHGEVRGA